MEKEVISVCHKCYRHVDCVKYEKNGSIYIDKVCPNHGKSTHLIEPDAEFYINNKYNWRNLQCYFIEITNRCNLACPHCYQMPDNKSIDSSVSGILNIVRQWPDDGFPVALVGAEPTIRDDLDEIMQEIWRLPGKKRDILILTNGVRLSNKKFADKFKDLDNVYWTFGLNHKDYSGEKIRQKQIEGINNCIANGMKIKNISYTLLDLTQLEDCIKEIDYFGKHYIDSCYRIRCGADIGRSPKDKRQIYLSELLRETENLCDKNGMDIVHTPDNLANRAHFPVEINGIPTKIIQWPDASTLDLSELQTEAIADILPGKPRSPLVHQVILRDGAINKGIELPDTIPDSVLKHFGII